MFALIVCNLAVLSVAMLFYTWRDLQAQQDTSNPRLNERVAYMLWVASQRQG